jgi:hypothetical protein
LLVLLARRLLEAAHALLALLSTDTDRRAIRDLVLSDEVREKMKAEAEADAIIESMLATEKDRQTAIALGREAGAREWAAAVGDLALACKIQQGVEQHPELERLAPFVKKACEVLSG